MEAGQDSVQLIKQALPVSNVVARYVQLKRKGNRMAACCPFHHEKTPSFYVDDEKGFFHCFGCGKGGDLIKFVEEIEKLPFGEALAFLAEIAGIELPKKKGFGPNRELVESLREINNRAVAFFQENLKRHKEARAYLETRGIKRQTAELFLLGSSPKEWDGLYNHLRSDFPPDLLLQSGLIRASKNGRIFDLFRERLIFPIRDAFGHVIAFGGRLMEGEGPKYINSPETPIYTKGRHLYNLDMAKPYLKRDPRLLIAEGYMDVIQVYQAGIGGVVAGLGTAFTPEQAKLITRYAQKVLLNFDGDAAGFKAARAAIEILLKTKAEIGVITLPDKQDPDDFIKAKGVQTYREYLDNPASFYHFLIRFLQGDDPENQSPHHQSLVVQEMCKTLDLIEDEVVRDHFMGRLAGDLGIKPHVIAQIIAKQKENPGPAIPKTPHAQAPLTRQKNPFTKLEQEFLYLVMHVPDFTHSFSEENRESLPRVINQIFGTRPWLVNFILADHNKSFEDQLQGVPELFQFYLRGIYFCEEFEASPERGEILLPDLIRTMLNSLAKKTQEQLKATPPGNEAIIRDLLKKNEEFMRLKHQFEAESAT